jgi:hypothetical protein
MRGEHENFTIVVALVDDWILADARNAGMGIESSQVES